MIRHLCAFQTNKLTNKQINKQKHLHSREMPEMMAQE